MPFEELKQRQSAMWGSGPFEEIEDLHRSWVEYSESCRDNGGIRQSRRYLLTQGTRH